MSIDSKVWVYVERLYIHAHGADTFRQLLLSLGIKYTNDLYNHFEETKPKYTFMSQENYDFANYMKNVPEEKYIPLLERIVFDPKVMATTRDNWNYYKEPIKKWLPLVRELLIANGIQLDSRNFRLIHQAPSQPMMAINKSKRLSSDVLQIKRRRLDLLEQQRAYTGIHTEPHIIMEIEDIRRELADYSDEAENHTNKTVAG